MVFTVFEHTKLHPFQNLSLGFILKIFLKFLSLDILIKYILIAKKECIDWFLESSSGMKFFQASVRAFVSVRQTNQIALSPFVCCFCFVDAFSFQGHTKIALKL